MDLNQFQWRNQPKECAVSGHSIAIKTEPDTDLWQKTYYGFIHDRVHAFTAPVSGDFTFSVKTVFRAEATFDQCGILMYQNSENWVKASVEYQSSAFGALGSVVTNSGYSDWASTDIAMPECMYYRFSRRGQDFYIEQSPGGEDYRQMRVLHMHHSIAEANVGVYACSPLGAGFHCEFSDLKFGPCLWEAYQ